MMSFEQILRALVLPDANRPSPGGYLPAGRDMRNYLLAALLASVPCIVFAVYYLGTQLLAMVAVAFAAGAAVEIVFSVVRKKALTGGTLVFAILLSLLLPLSTPLWMVALGSAFGTLFGKEVFGGTGHHIFSPVLLGIIDELEPAAQLLNLLRHLPPPRSHRPALRPSPPPPSGS